MTPAARSLSRAAAAMAVATLALLTTATLASAHTTLRSTNPEEGATVETLTEVQLEFEGDLLEIGTELSIVDAAGDVHALEAEFPSTNVVTAPVEPALANGEAELIWRVVAEDGHPIEGTVNFTYAGTATAEATEPAATTDPAPTATEAVPAPSASPTATDAPATVEPTSTEAAADEPAGVPGWVWAVIAVAAVVGAGVAIAVAKLRGRS